MRPERDFIVARLRVVRCLIVKDWKLSQKKHELALWIVGRHALPRDLNEATRSPLFGEMRAVLDDQEYEDFVAATARLSRRPIISVR